MSWINDDDLDLLDKVLESKELIPENKKGNLKLRHISFFYTNMKAITNVCKTLEKATKKISQPHQYTEVLRKMGLIKKNGELTTYGEQLLQVIHYDSNRIIDELSKPFVNIDSVPEDIIYTIEFFLYCVVRKCLSSPEECARKGIDYKDIDAEVICNLTYFFENIIDTLKEPTNKNTNVNDIFSLDNEDFYYTVQGMNFTGYEIKRLLRMPSDDIKHVWKLYNGLLDSVKSVDERSISEREKRYFEYTTYYNKGVQKDVRNRVRQAVFNYILFNSIIVQRNRIKLIKRAEYDAIIPYEYIEKKFYEYNLKDIYNLVFYERDSKYIVNEMKPFRVDELIVTTIDTQGYFDIKDDELIKQKINYGDSIAFINLSGDKLIRQNIYCVNSIESVGNDMRIHVKAAEAINMDCEQELLDKMKG